MTTRVIEVVPQTVFTLRANSTLQLLNLLDVSSFDQAVIELVMNSPPTMATNDVKLHTKTASQPLPVQGFDTYAVKTVTCGATVAGTPSVRRGAVWKVEYDATNNPEPLLALLAFSLENTTVTAITLDVQINVIGTGCGCGG